MTTSKDYIAHRLFLVFADQIGQKKLSLSQYYSMFHLGAESEMNSLVGFRFYPTDEEIMRLLKMKRLDPGFSVRTIKEIDFYSFEPWELPCK